MADMILLDFVELKFGISYGCGFATYNAGDVNFCAFPSNSRHFQIA